MSTLTGVEQVLDECQPLFPSFTYNGKGKDSKERVGWGRVSPVLLLKPWGEKMTLITKA